MVLRQAFSPIWWDETETKKLGNISKSKDNKSQVRFKHSQTPKTICLFCNNRLQEIFCLPFWFVFVLGFFFFLEWILNLRVPESNKDHFRNLPPPVCLPKRLCGCILSVFQGGSVLHWEQRSDQIFIVSAPVPQVPGYSCCQRMLCYGTIWPLSSMMLGTGNAFPESLPQICSLVPWFVGSQILPAVSVEVTNKLRFRLFPAIL